MSNHQESTVACSLALELELELELGF